MDLLLSESSMTGVMAAADLPRVPDVLRDGLDLTWDAAGVRALVLDITDEFRNRERYIYIYI